MKQILLIIFLGASVSATAQTLSLSFDDALRQMQQGNRSLKIADKGIETARTERIRACKVRAHSYTCPKR